MKSSPGNSNMRRLFVLLSLADLGLTWWLLSHSGGGVYESNPVARWWLTRFGWLGLFVFKAAMVALILGLVVVISRHRPRAARRVLGFGCSAMTAVVLYSSYLGLTVPLTPEAQLAAAEQVYAEQNRRCDRDLRRSEAHNAVLGQVLEELIAGRCTLAEAIDRVATTERSQDPECLKMLTRVYSVHTLPEGLACVLLRRVAIDLSQDPPAARRTLARLVREYQVVFGNRPLYDSHWSEWAPAEDQPLPIARLDTPAPEAEDIPTE